MPSLLKSLEDLGDQLVSAELPVDVRKVLGGLVYYVEHQTLEPPVEPASVAQAQQLHEDEAEIARLRVALEESKAATAAAVAAAQAAQAAAPAPPAAPAPHNPVLPVPPAPPAEAPAPPAVQG